ncbi:MAG: VanZ family protein [Leptothrix ochracea]|uniref:VanZ family protein n=1 Tax=Leptothrix ochracea TaxID=735331 RepID=UPI0034E2397D
MATPHYRSSAWPVAWIWIGLIVYASLHPFSGWRSSTSDWLSLLWLPKPHSSRFDLWSNFAAYAPLGLLMTVGRLRAGERGRWAAFKALLAGCLLSLLMEWTQNFLPMRVPSRLDLAMNSLGTGLGVGIALLLNRSGWLLRWQILRDTWLLPHGTVGIALLLSWPMALLFPPPLPLGMGQGLSHLSEALIDLLANTPWADWVPQTIPSDTLSQGSEMFAIALGTLAPCWVAFEMSRNPHRRLVLMAAIVGAGLISTTLSTALNFGPDHAMAWITPPVPYGLGLGLLLGAGLAWLPRRLIAAIGLIALTTLIDLVNQIPNDPYFALSLQGWEQGKFIRFHGMAEWLGWGWPFAALIFLLVRLTLGKEPPTSGPKDLSTIPP